MTIMRDLLKFDRVRLTSFHKNHGNYYVDVRNDGEHHSTIKAEATAVINHIKALAANENIQFFLTGIAIKTI